MKNIFIKRQYQIIRKICKTVNQEAQSNRMIIFQNGMFQFKITKTLDFRNRPKNN